MDFDLASLTVASALESLRAGAFTAAALTEACLRQIERLNPRLNAILTPTPELAVRAALQADALVALQPSNLRDIPLLGIPVGVKDLFETAGIRTTAGSKFLAEYVPSQDAEAVLRLKTAGACLVGKTNTHEMALGVTGINPHYGAARNPWDSARMTGGSSSGSAAAVVAGMCLAALGTDTGGSSRIPAALCGAVGLKPSYGRVSLSGVIPLSWNLDHVGVLTRSVRDAALLLQVLAGYDSHDPASVNAPVEDFLSRLDEGVRGWPIALAVGEYVEACDSGVWQSVQEAAGALRSLGARVEKVDLSWMADLALANRRMTQADAAAFHRQRLAEHPDRFGEDVRARLEAGAALPVGDYVLARRTQAEGRRRFEAFFEKYDLLVMPTTPITAPPIEGVDSVAQAALLMRFTAPFNLTGLPAISLPCGLVEGLPVGLQIVAAPWQESKALTAAQALEAALGRFVPRFWEKEDQP